MTDSNQQRKKISETAREIDLLYKQVSHLYRKLPIENKADFLRYILIKDAIIFNKEHKSLDDPLEVSSVSINRHHVQLTIEKP